MQTPSIALVEISRDYKDWARILGEHKWQLAIHNNRPADRERWSRIYYASFRDHRAAEKAGWKIKQIDDAFICNDVVDIVNSPYPKTTWCNTSHPDQTNFALLRPIPVDLFPDSAPKPKQKVVGKPSNPSANFAVVYLSFNKLLCSVSWVCSMGLKERIRWLLCQT
jgi:hypothetical protein